MVLPSFHWNQTYLGFPAFRWSPGFQLQLPGVLQWAQSILTGILAKDKLCNVPALVVLPRVAWTATHRQVHTHPQTKTHTQTHETPLHKQSHKSTQPASYVHTPHATPGTRYALPNRWCGSRCCGSAADLESEPNTPAQDGHGSSSIRLHEAKHGTTPRFTRRCTN